MWDLSQVVPLLFLPQLSPHIDQHHPHLLVSPSGIIDPGYDPAYVEGGDVRAIEPPDGIDDLLEPIRLTFEQDFEVGEHNGAEPLDKGVDLVLTVARPL